MSQRRTARFLPEVDVKVAVDGQSAFLGVDVDLNQGATFPAINHKQGATVPTINNIARPASLKSFSTYKQP